MVPKKQPSVIDLAETATIPELQQSKIAVLNTLASTHSRRSYAHAIERFIAWYCSEPRLEFNRSVVVKYRSFWNGASLSAAPRCGKRIASGYRSQTTVPDRIWAPPFRVVGDSVLYHYLDWAPQQCLGHSSGMAILRSSRLPSRDVAQWLCFTLRRL
jgi:hypothetical protein